MAEIYGDFMKTKTLFQASTLTLLTCGGIFLGCSGTNSMLYTGGGNQCAANTNPLDSSEKANTTFSKVVTKPSDATIKYPALPPGYYQYGGMKAFFYKTTSDFFVQIQDTPDASNVMQASNTCVRNMSPKIAVQDLKSSKNIVTSLTVDKEGIQTFTTKEIGYNIEGMKLMPLAKDTTQPSPVFEEVFGNGFPPVVYKTSPDVNDNSYQIRANNFQSDDVTQAVIFLTRKVAPDCADKDDLPLDSGKLDSKVADLSSTPAQIGLPDGNYQVKSSDVYFYDSSTSLTIRLNKSQDPTDVSKTKLQFTCALNYNFDSMKGLSNARGSLTHLVIKGGNPTVLKAETLGFQFNDKTRWIDAVSTPMVDTPSSLLELFGPTTMIFRIKPSDTVKPDTFEIHSEVDAPSAKQSDNKKSKAVIVVTIERQP
jgi:hypothetical protein